MLLVQTNLRLPPNRLLLMCTAKRDSQQWEKKEKNTDEGKDGHDVSSGTLVNSSNLCLKRDPENKKYMRENQVFSKATGSDVIMQRDNAAWER